MLQAIEEGYKSEYTPALPQRESRTFQATRLEHQKPRYPRDVLTPGGH
jgi:hypothetical protein